MGLFNFFKKKGDDNKDPRPEDQMLQLNQRQQPTLKSDTRPPGGTNPPQQNTQDVRLTPEPAVNDTEKTKYNFEEEPAPEPQQFARENLSTKSLQKNIQSMPSVKKLVIPGNNEAMEKKVEATDTVVAERVKLKQVELPGSEKSEGESLTPGDNFVPGEFIDLPISFFTDKIDSQYLSSNAKTLFDNTAKVRFTKDEILSIMAQGAFAVVGSALLGRFPAGMVSEKGKTTNDVLEFPLDLILNMVPPDWFAMQGQDNSLTESLDNMSNPFQDLEEPVSDSSDQAPKEDVKEETSKSSLFDSEDEVSVEVEDTLSTTIDSVETIDQSKAPKSEPEPMETLVQESAPPVESKAESLETMIQEAPPKIPSGPAPETDDNTLVVKAEAIEASLPPEIFSNFPKESYLKIPKDKVLASLAEGVFKLNAQEVDDYAGTSSVSPANASAQIEINLGLIMGLIPPEWFAIQGQDNSQNDLLSNMRDVFDDSTFEEAARELESSSEEEEVTQEPEEEEVKAEEESGQEEGASLITGGMFSKMNTLFEDEEEEEVSVNIEEETGKETVALIEEEQEESDSASVETPVIEDEEEPEMAIAPPVIEDEEEELEVTVEEEEDEIIPPVIEEMDSLQTITVNRSEDRIFDEGREQREQDKHIESLQEEIQQASEPEMPAESEIQEAPGETAARVEEKPAEETNVFKGAGLVTYRSIADEVPEVSSKSELRPSTAPNGIDINRSNLNDLCRLHSAGEKLAQTIIEYREKNGDFKSINELINIPGIGSSVYRSLTGLRPSADLVAAERRINKAVGLSSEKDYSLGKIIKEAQNKFGFKSLILSDKDGFEICSSGDKELLESNSELLAATTPQLFKRTRHFLKQSNLPHPEIFTFYLEDTPVTFGIADEVFMVMVHSSKWPEPKHMKQCKNLIHELAWFCSYRAIV